MPQTSRVLKRVRDELHESDWIVVRDDVALLTEELTNHPHRFFQVLLTLHS